MVNCKQALAWQWKSIKQFQMYFTCTISGEENPNISKPSRLPGGCKGGRFVLPNLCCFVISWFTLSLTISQHLAAEIWMNTSLGHCSKETWKKGVEMNSQMLIKIANFKNIFFFVINNFQIYINIKNREEDKVMDSRSMGWGACNVPIK